MNNNKKKKGNVLLKTSFWYTVSGFLSKGIVFIMLPFYVRLLTKEQYGDYSNMMSWINLIFGTAMMNLQFLIIKSQNTNRNEVPKYLINSYYAILSVLAVFAIPVIIFRNQLAFILQMDNFTLAVVLIYSAFVPMFYLYQAYLRSTFKLKEFVVINIVITALTAGLSILFLYLVKSESRYFYFVLTQTLPIIFFGIYYLIRVLIVERRVSKRHITEAFSLGLPMIPHLLGVTILSKIDRVMITAIVGSAATANYSVAYNLSMIVTTLSTALNSAFMPWLIKQLSEDKKESIKTPVLLQVLFIFIITIGISIVAPEVMIVWAGRKYAEVIYIIPPIMIGVMLTHIYTIFYNIEMFYNAKKMLVISSVIASIFNVVTNYIFISMFGYEAAAYTTLASNLLLVVLHGYAVKKIDSLNLLPIKGLLVTICISLISIIPMIKLYDYPILKYVIIAVILVVGTIVVLRNKEQILVMINTLRKGQNEID